MMVNANKLKILAKKKGMNLTLYKRRKQSSGTGVIWDFNVEGGRIHRVKIAEYRNPLGRNANVYYGESSKSGTEFKTESELVKFMQKYN